MFLSKTDYVEAQKCIKSLWLKKNRKDLKPEIDDATQKRFEVGEKLHELAHGLFPEGVMVPAENWDVINGSKITTKLSKEHNTLFEAFAKLDNGAFCRIDVLRKNTNGWDLIEIKSATKVSDEYIIDLAFQKYVFENAGYPINQCFVIHINNKYVRHGELDIKQLFTEENVTDDVTKVSPSIIGYVEQYMKVQSNENEPKVLLHSDCKDCPYFKYCGKDVPEYSALDLLRKDADSFYANTGKLEIKDIPPEVCSETQLIERNSYLTNKEYVDLEGIKEWLDKLEYPLYYKLYPLSRTFLFICSRERLFVYFTTYNPL